MPTQKNKEDFALLVADIFETAGRLRRLGDAVARTSGQSQARWQVLSVISEGRWTVPRIADRLGVTRQSVQRVADELHADGFAIYAANGAHARSPFLLPTAAGTRALGAISRAARTANARISGEIGTRSLQNTREGLLRLLEALRALDT